MENPAVIIVDMLNDFVTGNLKVRHVSRIIQPLKELVESAREIIKEPKK